MRGFLIVLSVGISLLQQCQMTNGSCSSCQSENNQEEFKACVRREKCDCSDCNSFEDHQDMWCSLVHCGVNNGRRFQNPEPSQDDFEKKYGDTLIEKIFKRLNDDQHYF